MINREWKKGHIFLCEITMRHSKHSTIFRSIWKKTVWESTLSIRPCEKSCCHRYTPNLSALIHGDWYINDWFHCLDMRVLPQPAHTLKLKSIENIWSHVARTVCECGRRYDTVSSLIEAIDLPWSGIDMKTVRRQVTTMSFSNRNMRKVSILLSRSVLVKVMTSTISCLS